MTEVRIRIHTSLDGIVVEDFSDSRHVLDGAAVRRLRAIGRQADTSLLQLRDPGMGERLRVVGAELWRRTIAAAGVELPGEGVIHIEISLSAPLPGDLASIPWECMVGAQDVPVAFHPRFTVSRADVRTPEAPSEYPDLGTLRVLVLAPDTSGPLPPVPGSECEEVDGAAKPIESQAEIDRLGERLDLLVAEGLARFYVLGPRSFVTLRDVRRALESHRPHVVHYIGHSTRAAGSGGVTYFLFDGDDRRLAWFPERQILSLFLHLERVPRLLVLNSCRSGTPFSIGLPHKLQQLGVRAVIAMRHEIFDTVALRFATALYREMAIAHSLGAAIQAARYHLTLDREDWGDWFLPVLYTRQPELRLIRMREASSSRLSPRRIISTFNKAPTIPFKGLLPYEDVDAEHFFGREEEVERVLGALLIHKTLILHGASGVGKTSPLQAGLLPRLEALRFEPIYVGHWHAPIDEMLVRLGIRREGGLPLHGTHGHSDQPAALEELFEAVDRLDRPKVLILDQAEKILGTESQRELIGGLWRRRSKLSHIVISVRSADLQFLRFLLSANTSRPPAEIGLSAMKKDAARKMLTYSHHPRVRFEEGLVDRLLTEVTADDGTSDPPVLLSQLSFVLRQLYQCCASVEESPLLTRAALDELGSIADWLPRQLGQTLEAFDTAEAEIAHRVLRELVDPFTQSPLALAEKELRERTGAAEEQLRGVLSELENSYLLRRLPSGELSVVHELLATTIIDQLVPRHTVQENQALAALRFHLSMWNTAGVPLSSEKLELVQATFERLELTDAELALFIGSALITEQSWLDARLRALDGPRIRAVIEALWQADHPEVMTTALAFADRWPPHRRGLAPLPLAAGPGLEPIARYAGELLLRLLARKAQGRPSDPDGLREKEISEQHDVARRLLRRLKKDRPTLDDPQLLDDVLALKLMEPHDDGHHWDGHSEVFAPVPRPGRLLAFCAALGSVVALSWLVWPDGSASVSQLKIFFLLALSPLFGMVFVAQESSIGILLRDGPLGGFARQHARLKRLRHDLFFLVASTPSCFVFGHAVFALSEALHSFLWNSPIRFFGDTLSQLQLRLASGEILGVMVAAGKAVAHPALLYIASIAILSVLLAPAVLLLTAAQLALGRAFDLWQRKRHARWLAEAGITLVSVGACMPMVLHLAASLAELIELSWTWKADVFFGADGIEVLRASFQGLGDSSACPWIVALLPLLAVLFSRGAGKRSFRRRAGFLNDVAMQNRQPESLRPLVAEATAEALDYVCELLERWPETRSLETRDLLYALAVQEPGAFLGEMTPPQQHRIAARAADVLGRVPIDAEERAAYREDLSRHLDTVVEQPKYLLVLRRRLECPEASPESSRRGLGALDDSVRGLRERIRSAWHAASGAESRRARWSRRGLLILVMAALFAGGTHVAIFIVTQLADLLLPLSEPVGRSLFDPGTIVTLVVRLAEAGLFALPIYAFVRRRKRSREVSPEGGTGQTAEVSP